MFSEIYVYLLLVIKSPLFEPLKELFTVIKGIWQSRLERERKAILEVAERNRIKGEELQASIDNIRMQFKRTFDIDTFLRKCIDERKSCLDEADSNYLPIIEKIVEPAFLLLREVSEEYEINLTQKRLGFENEDGGCSARKATMEYYKEDRLSFELLMAKYRITQGVTSYFSVTKFRMPYDDMVGECLNYIVCINKTMIQLSETVVNELIEVKAKLLRNDLAEENSTQFA